MTDRGSSKPSSTGIHMNLSFKAASPAEARTKSDHDKNKSETAASSKPVEPSIQPPAPSGVKRPSPLSSASSSTTATSQQSKTPKLAISLPTIKDKSKPAATLPPTQISSDVKKIFNPDEEDDEEEEIPIEARIRMRNKGRENPVACGPNSYGKTRLGFCDYRSMQERDLEEKAKELGNH